MAFQLINSQRSSVTRGTPPLVSTVKATVAGPLVRFVMSEDVHKAMGAAKFCQVLIGSGKDAGRIAIAPCASKSAKTHTIAKPEGARRRQVTVTATKLGIPPQDRPASDIGFSITDDGLVLDIRPLRKPVAVANAA